MKPLLVLPALLVAGVAHAQAPGEVAPTAPPPAATPPATVARTAEVEPMKNRISVGLGVGSVAFGDDVSFHTGNIAVRYRVARTFELELELFGGRQALDGGDGPLAIGGGFLGLRYRFMPERKWNGYAGVGVGQVIIEQHETTDEMLDGAKRPLFRLSAGLEHRWQRFSFGAEAAILAAGERDDYGTGYYDGYVEPEAVSALELSLCASVYF